MMPSLMSVQRLIAVVAQHLAQDTGGRFESAHVVELQADVTAEDAAFEFVGGLLGHQLPPIEHCEPAGELVRLIQVLRGEQDRDATGREVADNLPHRVATARIQSGGRLVEEDDARVADQGHRQVEPAPHAPRVGGGQLPGCVDQVEAVKQLGCALPAFGSAQVVQVGHQQQILLSSQQVVHRRELAGDADRSAHRVRLPDQVVAGNPRLATIGADERGQDLNHRRLTSTIGAQQREDRSRSHVQVDAVEHHVVAERFTQSPCFNHHDT
jgi:hypothetical protein